MLLCIADNEPAHINMHVVWELPPGPDLDRITEALAVLHARHESLRTIFPAGAEPLQQVCAAGELTVRVYAAQGDAALFAEELGLRWRAVRFDPTVELPVRAAVVLAGTGRPSQLVLVLSHAAVDASALGLLRREWLALLAGEPLGEPAAVRPVDLAHIERSPEGQRRAAASLRYWAGQLRTVPQAMFAVPAAPVPSVPPPSESPPSVPSPSPAAPSAPAPSGPEPSAPGEGWTPRLRIRSHAAAAALDVLTERTGVSRSSLVLAALCALTAHRTGHRQAVVTTLSANRYLPELKDYVGTVAQDALFSVAVDAGDFESLARRVRKRSQLAYPHSWFESQELWGTIDATGYERGTRFARDCIFNDLSPLGLDGGVLRGGADPRDPAQAVQLTWLPAEPIGVQLMLWVFRLEGELDLSLWANPSRLARQEAELFGRGLASLLIEAARGDIKLDEIEDITALPPVVRGPRWLVSDNCWVDLDQLDELLTHVLAPLPGFGSSVFRVLPEPDERVGQRLVCHLADPGGPVADGEALASAPPESPGAGRRAWSAADLERIHAACVAALPVSPAVMAPHHYVLHEGAPADPADPTAWRALPVLLEGSGRAARPAC
ncbi:condensation domain-containing protein [Streptomyces polygonati]|uniref:Condensation domain-containing protein n=1 Tax=Streptomyces polygonati TaxID=1617087 RepID=A0ABV8HY56_9ACTN